MSAAYEKGMAHYQILWGKTLQEGMTVAELNERKGLLREAMSRLDAIKTSCEYCVHLRVVECVKFKSEVPVEFQRTPDQCSSWEYDAIPL